MPQTTSSATVKLQSGYCIRGGDEGGGEVTEMAVTAEK
jgi:hypothetical protein